MSKVQLEHRVSIGDVTFETKFYCYMYYWTFLFLLLCIAIRLWSYLMYKLFNKAY